MAPENERKLQKSSRDALRISSKAVRSWRPTYAGNMLVMTSTGFSFPVIPVGWTFFERSNCLRRALFCVAMEDGVVANVRPGVKSRIHGAMWERSFLAMSVALGEPW